MATEQEVANLRTHAQDRIKAHGTNAILKVRATLCLDIASGLVTAQTQVAAAEKPLDPDEAGKVSAMREERDAANSAKAEAEKEIGLLRAVAEAGEGGKKKEVNAAIKAYRAEYPAAAGNTAERAPDGGEADAPNDEATGDENAGDVDIAAGEGADPESGQGGGG